MRLNTNKTVYIVSDRHTFVNLLTAGCLVGYKNKENYFVLVSFFCRQAASVSVGRLK